MTEHKHPSYGRVSISRIQGVAYLFGSNIRHENYVRLEIETAMLRRDLNRDWIFGNKPLVTINMSESQFAQLIMSANTSGVPCTIRHVQGQQIEPYEKLPGVREKFDAEIKKDLADLIKKVRFLKQEVVRVLDQDRIKKSDVGQLNNIISNLQTELESNIPFVEQSFKEVMNKEVGLAKGEIETYLQGALQRLGAETIKDLPSAEF